MSTHRVLPPIEQQHFPPQAELLMQLPPPPLVDIPPDVVDIPPDVVVPPPPQLPPPALHMSAPMHRV
ncbi:MAG: hypothetical protein FJ095_18405 [Deltaproteobacteria bacterium]|nr:hypothetical protein [Deltaproteobacteria bacterium]